MPITLAYIGIARAEAQIAVIRPFLDRQSDAGLAHAFLNELEVARHLRPLRRKIQRRQGDPVRVTGLCQQAPRQSQVAGAFGGDEHRVGGG